MSGALSETEIARLAARLSARNSANALSLEGVDGLFCALLASSTMVAPSSYLSVIFGGEPGNAGGFADLQDANETLSLLMRYWNSIAEDFGDEGLHLPYIEEPGTRGTWIAHDSFAEVVDRMPEPTAKSLLPLSEGP